MSGNKQLKGSTDKYNLIFNGWYLLIRAFMKLLICARLGGTKSNIYIYIYIYIKHPLVLSSYSIPKPGNYHQQNTWHFGKSWPVILLNVPQVVFVRCFLIMNFSYTFLFSNNIMEVTVSSPQCIILRGL